MHKEVLAHIKFLSFSLSKSATVKKKKKGELSSFAKALTHLVSRKHHSCTATVSSYSELLYSCYRTLQP